MLGLITNVAWGLIKFYFFCLGLALWLSSPLKWTYLSIGLVFYFYSQLYNLSEAQYNFYQ